MQRALVLLNKYHIKEKVEILGHLGFIGIAKNKKKIPKKKRSKLKAKKKKKLKKASLKKK